MSLSPSAAPMQLDEERVKIMNAFTREVAAFARSLPSDDLAKLLGFFHLAEMASAPDIDLEVDASGQVALKITMPSIPRD